MKTEARETKTKTEKHKSIKQSHYPLKEV